MSASTEIRPGLDVKERTASGSHLLDIGIEPPSGDAISISSHCPQGLSAESIYAHHQYSIENVRRPVMEWLRRICTDDMDEDDHNMTLLLAIEQLGFAAAGDEIQPQKADGGETAVHYVSAEDDDTCTLRKWYLDTGSWRGDFWTQTTQYDGFNFQLGGSGRSVSAFITPTDGNQISPDADLPEDVLIEQDRICLTMHDENALLPLDDPRGTHKFLPRDSHKAWLHVHGFGVVADDESKWVVRSEVAWTL